MNTLFAEMGKKLFLLFVLRSHLGQGIIIHSFNMIDEINCYFIGYKLS